MKFYTNAYTSLCIYILVYAVAEHIQIAAQLWVCRSSKVDFKVNDELEHPPPKYSHTSCPVSAFLYCTHQRHTLSIFMDTQ